MAIRANNCNDCGCLPCCCVTKTDGAAAPQSREHSACNEKHIVHESVGDCTPLQPDPLKIISGDCCPPRGGDMTIQAPKYFMTVENPPDNVLRDSGGSPILDSDGNVVANSQ